MKLFFVNSQPYLEYPIVEEGIERKKNKECRGDNSGITQSNRNACKIRYFGGISMNLSRNSSLNKVELRLVHNILINYGRANSLKNG